MPTKGVIQLKRLLAGLFILGCVGLARADIAVTQGAGKTVATTTDASREFQNVVVSTTQIMVEGGVLAPVGYATTSSSYMPVAVKNSVAINNLVSSMTIIQPTVLGATVTFNGTQNVQLQTGANAIGSITNAAFGITQPTVLGATITFNGTQNVQLQTGTNAIGNVIISTGGVSSQELILVSSNTTLPAQVNDTLRASLMGDNEGRIVTQAGVPTAVYLTTAPSISNSGYAVLVASPAATLFTHMCGCVFANTSATGVTANLYPSGVVTTTNNPTLYLPPTDNRGLWPGCDKPFLNTTAGGVQVTVKISAAVSTISGFCQYYQSTSP